MINKINELQQIDQCLLLKVNFMRAGQCADKAMETIETMCSGHQKCPAQSPCFLGRSMLRK